MWKKWNLDSKVTKRSGSIDIGINAKSEVADILILEMSEIIKKIRIMEKSQNNIDNICKLEKILKKQKENLYLMLKPE